MKAGGTDAGVLSLFDEPMEGAPIEGAPNAWEGGEGWEAPAQAPAEAPTDARNEDPTQQGQQAAVAEAADAAAENGAADAAPEAEPWGGEHADEGESDEGAAGEGDAEAGGGALEPDPAGARALQAGLDAALAAYETARGVLAGPLAWAAGLPGYARVFGEVQRAACESGAALKDALWDGAMERLCQTAERRFAHASGVALRVDRDALTARFTREEREADAEDEEERAAIARRRRRGWDTRTVRTYPTMPEVWAYLAETYDTAAAAEAREREAVEEFVDTFCRSYRGAAALKPPVWRRGRLVLELQMWRDRWSDRKEYSYSSRERAQKDLATLAVFCQVIGRHALASACRARAWDRLWSDPVVSRGRYELEEGCGLVTFAEKVEIELSAEVAADVMARVGAHMGAHMAEGTKAGQ